MLPVKVLFAMKDGPSWATFGVNRRNPADKSERFPDIVEPFISSPQKHSMPPPL
jgi:hypothetical protein